MAASVQHRHDKLCNKHKQRWLHGYKQAYQMLLREMHGVEQIALRIIAK
jgi:hypothetical protein